MSGWMRGGIALVGVALMYVLLGPARGVSEVLRAAGRLEALIDGLAIAFTYVVVRYALGEEEKNEYGFPSGSAIVASTAYVLVSFGLSTHWSIPEERFHMPQYAAVAMTMWWVFRGRFVPALLAVLAVGVGDEMVQWVLPNRTFDPRDVFANACCGAAVVTFISGGRRRWLGPGLLGLCWGVLTAFPPYIAPAPFVEPGEETTPQPVEETPQPAPSLESTTTGTVVADGPYADAPVILLTIDALRADHVQPWGDAPVDTPNLDRLSRESLAFSEALSDAAWTSPGVVSLLTGLSPAVHGVETRGFELAPAVDTLPDRLRAAGYRTLGFAGDDSETYHHLGFEAILQRDLPSGEALAAGLDAAAKASPDAPVFAWLHLRHIHAPYQATPERLAELGLQTRIPDAPILNRARRAHTVPRSGFPGRHDWLRPAIAALYAAEVADADDALGEILAVLEQRGLLDEAIVILTADHGEELLEHHGIGHASTTLNTAPHPEVTEIPLLVRLPDGRAAASVRDRRVLQSDVAPTLLGLLGLPTLGRGDDFSDVVLNGPELDASRLRDPDHLPPTRGVLLSTSPCGWQCPDEQKDERVHAWLMDDERVFCRAMVGKFTACPEAVRKPLKAALAERARLGTPVPTP